MYKNKNFDYLGFISWYKSYKFDLASPSIDHSIKFRDSLRYASGISIEFSLGLIERLRIYLLVSDTSERLYYLYDS